MIKLILAIFLFVSTLFEIGVYLLIEFPNDGITKLFFTIYFISIYFFFSSLLTKGDRNGLKSTYKS